MLIGVIAEQLLLPSAIVEVNAATDAITANASSTNLINESIPAQDNVNALDPRGEPLAEMANAVDAVVPVLIYSATVIDVAAAASAEDAAVGAHFVTGAIDEAASADSVQDATIISALVARHAMLPAAFVNSDGTSRAANVDGTMVNL